MLVECLPLEDALCLADADGFDLETIIVPQENYGVWRESADFSRDFFESLGISARRHTSVWNAIKLAFENAFLRGNYNCPSKKVYVRTAIGKKGIFLQIEDEGSGFDYRRIIPIMFAGKPYAQGFGMGLKALREAPVTAGYQGKGNIVNIVIARNILV